MPPHIPRAATALAQQCCVHPEMRGALSLSQSDSQVNCDGDLFLQFSVFLFKQKRIELYQKISVHYYPMKLAGGVNQVAT